MIHTSAPHVLVLSTEGLGDRSYIVHDGRSALVIDPQRDIDRIEHLAAEHGLIISHVLETHIHNDYVSGGLELSRRHGATYVVPVTDGIRYEHHAGCDGETFVVGALTVQVTSTPGHTPNHVAYIVTRDEHSGAVFTGGSMLYGAVGRPDLVQPDLTEGLAHDQWRSVQRLARELPQSTHVYPTHGFGSFCAATQNEGTSGTIADEHANNPALRQDEDSFVDEMLAALDVFPAYYAHMGPANVAGPLPADISLPSPAEPAELRQRIDAGEWVVDLRSREVFGAAHLRGTLSYDLDGAFATYLGWMIPWGTPLTLLGDTTEQIEAAQRELVRIGIDRPVAQAVGDPTFWAERAIDLAANDRTDFAGLAQVLATEPDTYLLDVRQHLEYRAGHLASATHIPFYRLLDEVDRLPRGKRIHVYCGSGYRAAVSASILQRAGYADVVHVDDDWENAAAAGLVIAQVPPTASSPGWTWTESRAAGHRYLDPVEEKASA